MSNELTGKVIFLTGGGQGIGRECALAYVRAGATVAIADINLEIAQTTVTQDLHNEGLALHCDVAVSTSVQAAIQATLTRYGRIDAIHNLSLIHI